MDSELLEHQLKLLHGKPVTIVRPIFGTQSDSFHGNLLAYKKHYPILFEFQCHTGGLASTFTVSDVSKLKLKESTIYLKGPQDYIPHSFSHTSPLI